MAFKDYRKFKTQEEMVSSLASEVQTGLQYRGYEVAQEPEDEPATATLKVVSKDSLYIYASLGYQELIGWAWSIFWPAEPDLSIICDGWLEGAPSTFDERKIDAHIAGVIKTIRREIDLQRGHSESKTKEGK